MAVFARQKYGDKRPFGVVLGAATDIGIVRHNLCINGVLSNNPMLFVCLFMLFSNL